MNCWQTLGIAPTGDEAAIKTAYAALIRQHRPDRDPAGFRRVRAAYEEALRLRPYYENHRDEPRRPTSWTPGNPPVAADDSDENSVSQHEPSQPYPLAEPAAHDYRYTPPAAPEQPYPLSEPAAHDYQDGSAHPILTPLEATVLLRQLQQAWQGQDDAQLLAILQSQAAHPALDNIDFRLDYIAELLTHLDDDTYPRSNLWVQQYYEQHDPDDDRQLNEYTAAYCRQWEEAINDSELCRTLQRQAADPVLTAIAVRDVWLAALVDYLTNSLARPRSYYWARTQYPSAFPDTIPPTYRDYPSERIATFTRALLQAADDAALTALLESQAADPILAYPPARSQYLAQLAEQRPDWCDRPAANRWLDEHYTLPHINPATRQQALLARLHQEWQGQNDDQLLAILQAQATLPSLEHIDLRSDYTAALQAHLMQQHLPHSTLWVDAHYQLGRHDPAWQQQRQLAYIAAGDRRAFAGALTNTNPDLATWLRKNPLRRYASLWRDWAATRIHPAYQDYQRLRSSLWPAIAASPLSYAPPRNRRKLWIFINIIFAIVFIGFVLSNIVHDTPPPDGKPPEDVLPFFLDITFLIFSRHIFSEHGFRRIDPDHILNRICPPLRTLHDYYRPCPRLLQWLITDIAVLLTLYLTATRYPQTLHDTLTLGTLWLIGRFMQTLWQCKRAITAGWRPPPPQDKLLLQLVTFLYILGLIYSLIPANWRLLPAQITVQNITAILSLSIYRYSWWYLPPDAVNLRRAMFDHGVIAILIVAAYIIGNLPGSDEHAFIVKTPLLTALSLITAPALALVLIYSYAPPPPNRKTAKHLATAATILMALGISAISYNVFRKDIPGPVAVLLGLIVAVFITARNPPRPETIHRSLAALIHFLALACLYILAYVAMLNLVGNLKDYTGDARPGIILLASLILHSIATLSHYNWQRKHT